MLAMIALMLVAAQAGTPAATAPDPGADIVIVGQRMKRIRVVTRHDRKTGATRCIVRRSSRDPALDAAFCEAVLACAATETKREGMNACMGERMTAIARRFARPAGSR
jgi:hypothetical protein